ncbi:hypothetical protein CSC76_07755 [Pseudoxanthomonas mexicana]|uniref:hypothetical protein n=1 Tax=Pseudoxanthomonas mexicana TaxID=128785 RepID=UPI00138A3425|nr:hypothetical protein [Pseudoxanthomonas mexicana]KAF1727990.1 hypothetical protein CSC76_07755 [Pseudoxanthomonas mexicana]
MTTAYAPTWPRDTGRYDSSERLPDIEALFDRTLNQIRHIHEVRQRNPKPFDRLWEQVVKRLKEFGNATAYAHWKQRDIIRNAEEFAELDAKLGEAWASLLEAGSADDAVREAADEAFRKVHKDRAELTAVVKGAIDDALEIAIAYWIEARNAHNNGDPLRALNCLVECHFFLGITYSPKTDYEAKSEAGEKSGKKERDAIAAAALEVMGRIKIDRTLRSPDFLLGKVVQLIEADPVHAKALEDFSQLTAKGRRVQNSPADRFSNTLNGWITDKEQPYPRITALYRYLCSQIEAAAHNKKGTPRKVNG